MYVCMLSPRQHTKTVSHPLDTLQHHTVSGSQNEYGNIRQQHYFTRHFLFFKLLNLLNLILNLCAEVKSCHK